MAKVQSRKTVSITREDHADLEALCKAHGVPVSQATTQAVRALLDGRLPLEPAKSMHRVTAETYQRRAAAMRTAMDSVSPAAQDAQ